MYRERSALLSMGMQMGMHMGIGMHVPREERPAESAHGSTQSPDRQRRKPDGCAARADVHRSELRGVRCDGNVDLPDLQPLNVDDRWSQRLGRG